MATHAICAINDFDAVWIFKFVALSFGGRSAVKTFSGTVLPRFHLFLHRFIASASSFIQQGVF